MEYCVSKTDDVPILISQKRQLYRAISHLFKPSNPTFHYSIAIDVGNLDDL